MDLDSDQSQGAAWLASMARALLADVMGVGKTAQAIEASRLVGARTIVVACQGQKRADWAREFATWWNASPPIHLIETGEDVPRVGHVNLCSYDLVDNVVQYLTLTGYRVDVLIVDEVQFLKSVGALRSKNVLGKGGLVHFCDRVWLLTGTPFLNHPAEMWTWLYVLFPEVIDYMTYEKFVDAYCIVRATQWGESIIGVKNTPDLRRRLWPIMLRRTDEAIEKPAALPFEDLVVEAPLPLELAALEAGAAGKAVRQVLSRLDTGTDFDIDAIENNEYVATLRRVTGLAKTPAICTAIAAELVAKPGEKIGVFAIHRDVIELAAAHFEDAGLNPVVVHGTVTVRARDDRKAQFINDPKVRVWIGQLDAAGTGTDGLQYAAHNALLLESSWIALNNLQAVKRFDRRGQRFPVRTRFGSLANSLDALVQRANRRKTQIFSQLFG